MKLLNDLRFFLGLFFLIIGLILMGVGFVNPSLQAGINLNLITGAAFVVFAALALCLALIGLKQTQQV